MTRADDVARLTLGGTLVAAGVSHLTVAREGFRAQVPDWVPFSPDETVLMSGIVEMGLGAALIGLPRERRRVGWITALFFAAIFPGNVSQWRHHRDSLGLDTDRKRAIRLVGQPLLIAAALFAGGILTRRR